MLRRRPLMRAAVGTAVVAGTATAVSGRVRRRQDRRWQERAQAEAYEQEQMAAPQAPTSPPPTADPVEQLKQLGALHEQGVLTDAEFEAEKAKIIAG